MEGPDHKASLEPIELKAMVSAIRNVELALGNGIKLPSASEKKNTNIARKSIHLAKNVEKGKVISMEDLIIKRPGNGLSPLLINDVIGCLAKNELVEDTQLQLKDIEWK